MSQVPRRTSLLQQQSLLIARLYQALSIQHVEGPTTNRVFALANYVAWIDGDWGSLSPNSVASLPLDHLHDDIRPICVHLVDTSRPRPLAQKPVISMNGMPSAFQQELASRRLSGLSGYRICI